jgi:butyryl-CoA dehydrogenase
VPDGENHTKDPLGPRYRIFGDKMWISAGEHDFTENIVHLLLAKTPGLDGLIDPTTRGISLFIVPKVLPNLEGTLGERNDVTLVGLNHKLGMHAVTNTALSFGGGTHSPGGTKGAIGYLVGDAGDGLRQMFHMMNAARTEIGVGASALGVAGYAVSLDYAKSRVQGRPIRALGKAADVTPVPIIEHADVKRMLLAQKAFAEGSLALGLFAGRLLDEQKTGSPESAERAGHLLEILTPIVKSFPSEWCLEANSLAIQVLGGAGYTRDFLVEKYWRDQRLNMIHEGTHGIQGIDLLGRKVRLANGLSLTSLAEAVEDTATRADANGLGARATELRRAWATVEETVREAWSAGDASAALANATLFLQGMGHVVVAWILLDVAIAAANSNHLEAPGKLTAMNFFFTYELPKSAVWLRIVAEQETMCRDVDPAIL